MKQGKLYLIPTPISENKSMRDVLLKEDIDVINSLEYFVSEKAKTARFFLKDLPLEKKIQEINITELNEHTKDTEINKLLEPALNGRDIGLLSDAGVPSIADPGFRLVSLAQKKKITVIPFVGPSSILMALMASGLNGQSFSFLGYLPREKNSRRKKIKILEEIALTTKQTQIFMETPYRNQHLFDDILDVCEPDTRVCIAMDIMGENEYIVTKEVQEWNPKKVLAKKPCLFLINK
ncbi:MAG: SAM-dependent methyltransferase [Candidatus Dojkabacteria bacterium]|nr:SAM-dependent methyltransferase [Candidatus Dojkabacteria bacterium]MDD4561188.1 SAM-dependent methyltransferase [Candidatus Dojkabacteria bacterium]NLB12077.1 SAM-dependent methyltransferase [Candidatus Dojkabacteria bacterium]